MTLGWVIVSILRLNILSSGMDSILTHVNHKTVPTFSGIMKDYIQKAESLKRDDTGQRPVCYDKILYLRAESPARQFNPVRYSVHIFPVRNQAIDKSSLVHGRLMLSYKTFKD